MQYISVEMQEKLHHYIQLFSAYEADAGFQAASTEYAEDFFLQQVPLLDCPDPVLEEIYYFRWWTYRKHIRKTYYGHIVTEFLANVPWAGPENSIVCAAGFHIREGRWLRDPDNWLREYIHFWFDGPGDIFAYSSWLPSAVWEYCSLKDDFLPGIELLPQMISFFETREQTQKRACGLYWSRDDRDGMEFSISGSGFRPTLNSYACADAYAISRFAAIAGNRAACAKYQEKAELLKEKINRFLWTGDFYQTIPAEEQDNLNFIRRPAIAPAHNVRELIGLIPWYFSLPNQAYAKAFDFLTRQDVFQTRFGLTTAEQTHPRYLEPHRHECLWNGYIWPFATAQVLVACANLLHNGEVFGLSRNTYYEMLHTYADAQHLTLESGKRIPWIDENLDPRTGRWASRDILQHAGWPDVLGGCERGKDYNHSLFCDLVLSGLLGIGIQNGTWDIHPLIPDSWTYFQVENIFLNGDAYRITYDRTGRHFGCEPGLHITKIS